ncbi:MAG: right-handed parallel beta-helix repeat-containing protein [Planctomycetota bacterium]
MKRLLTICAVATLVLAMTATAKAVTWNVPEDFSNIQAAIDSPDVLEGHTILVGPGNHAGALVTKAVEIKGEGGAVINDGPAHGSGLIQGFRLLADSNGATISHLDFTVDLAIMNGAAVDDVTVDHCTFTSPIQGVSNWEGSGWNISHNVINGLRTRSGGGIGIFIGCWSGAIAENNLVAHNKITGTVVVPDNDCGGYSTPGIAMMSDRRWNRLGGTISGNRVIKNKVSLSITVPEGPNPMEAVGIELTDMGLELLVDPVADLTENKVGFNDVRGVIGVPIALNPAEVAMNNAISRNLGDDTNNRGHGLHPKLLLH